MAPMKPSAMDLARYRDTNKGLTKEDAGFPQGANFSPFLSCLGLGKAIKSLQGLIMYMDDGLIYADTRAQLGQRIRRLKERLETIGLSLAEEKSKEVKSPEAGFQGIKFLGIRVTQDLEVWSETRSGTKKLATTDIMDEDQYNRRASLLGITKSYDEVIRDLIDRLRASTASEKRVREWASTKAKNPLDALRWAAEKGFFSNIIAEIHNPDTSTDRRDQLIGEARLQDLVDGGFPFSSLLVHGIKRKVANRDFVQDLASEIMNPEISPSARLQLIGELEKFNKVMKDKAFSTQVIRRLRQRDVRYIPDLTTLSTEVTLALMKRLRRKGSRLGRRKLARE
jgi:hypothetical protein